MAGGLVRIALPAGSAWLEPFENGVLVKAVDEANLSAFQPMVRVYDPADEVFPWKGMVTLEGLDRVLRGVLS